jgi:hypothetical protein
MKTSLMFVGIVSITLTPKFPGKSKVTTDKSLTNAPPTDLVKVLIKVRSDSFLAFLREISSLSSILSLFEGYR